MSRRTSKLTPRVWPGSRPAPAASSQAGQWLTLASLSSARANDSLPTQPSGWPALSAAGGHATCASCGTSLAPGTLFCSQCGSPQSATSGIAAVAWMRDGQPVPLLPVPVVVVVPKSVGLAAFLELLFPGAGLAYLGKIVAAVFIFFLSLALGGAVLAITGSTLWVGLFVVAWMIVRLGGIINDTERYNRRAMGLAR